MMFKVILSILMVCSIKMQQIQQPSQLQKSLEHDYQELSKIETQIQQRTGGKDHLHLKISRLFQHSIKYNEQNLNIEDISLLPSISVPYKENLFYSMLLLRKQSIYTLRGDTVVERSNNQILVSSVRNEHTYFGQFLPNSTINISRLKIVSKKMQIQYQTFINLKDNQQVTFDIFVFSQLSANRYYIFASSKQRIIMVFEKNGTFVKEIKTQTPIKKIKKLNNNLVVLTENELFFLNLNKNLSKTSCLLPYLSIDNFQYDEGNLKQIYGQNDDSIIQFELYSNCRPIKRFFILPNSSFSVAGKLLFLSSPQINYVINITSSQAHQYEFPFGQCQGQTKVQMNRKLHSSYIVSQICLGPAQINMTHILLELQESTTETTDFSKFRIPLLFISFGIIIYVTVKNKSKTKPDEEQDEKLIQDNLLKSISTMKKQYQPQSQSQESQEPLQPQQHPQDIKPKQTSINRKIKKN